VNERRSLRTLRSVSASVIPRIKEVYIEKVSKVDSFLHDDGGGGPCAEQLMIYSELDSKRVPDDPVH
jgi:hypothetical protein